MKLLFLLVLNCLGFVKVIGAERNNKAHRQLVINNNPREYDKLRNLLGYPKDDPITARALRGIKRITKLHKLCERKHGLNDEWSEDRTAYDKMICGLFTKRDMYKQHKQEVARILSRKNNSKSLEKEKSDLLHAVNLMAKMAGPLPMLKFAGR